MNYLETDRLIIRRFKQEDAEDLHAYLSLEQVVHYEPYGVASLDECRVLAKKRAESHYFWAVCLKPSNKLIGHLYFDQQEPEKFMTWILGYVFNPEYSKQGYATEACKQLLEYCFNELNGHRVIAKCNPENVASWKLLERLTMRREAHFIKPAFFKTTEDGKPIWHDTYQYSILNEEWMNRKED